MYATYPANLLAGLYMKDLGEQTSENSGLMQVLRTHFRWCIGMMIEDERCVQRYANIATTGNANTFDESILIDALGRLPNSGNAPGTCILVNRTLQTQINIRATVAKTNAYYTQDEAGDVFGRRVTRFQGVPILTADMILDTETALT
jgi:hypothetical protein